MENLAMTWVTLGLTILLSVGYCRAGDAPHWSYHGEHKADHWGEMFSICKADSPRQSPIDIPGPGPGTFYDERLTPISLLITRFDKGAKFKMNNNGHSVNIDIPGDVYVEGGNLGDVYKMAGVHFHWGSESAIGSEHTVATKRFPLEMHMVNFDAETHDIIATAVNGDNSLAVLGTLFEISEKDNPAFEPIIKALSNTEYPDDDTKLGSLDLKSLLPKNTKDYYRYEGSLTTPPCFESVVWTVFEETQTISEKQMKKFRALKESHDTGLTIIDNWRPVQEIHRRKVFRSFRTNTEVAAYSGLDGAVQYHQGSGASTISSHLLLPSLLTIISICITYLTK